MRILFSIALLVVPELALAHPVISEVMWAGSDLSTSDEWLEIANPTDHDIDLSGWSVTSLNSKGEHAVSVRFESGSSMGAGEYLVIASRSATASRLAAGPFVSISSLSLPNTKLLVRLLDPSGQIVDEVDDGSGAPFAGANPSGTGAKASMERLDLLTPGTVKENWSTAAVSLGFDPGPAIFGTPGFAREIPEADDPAPCTDPLEIAIAVQSGPLVATGKATINFQAVATAGSLNGVVCRWSFGDGFQSDSCNPPVHSFTEPGTYTVRVEAKNQCGNTLVQEQIVEVLPDPSISAAPSPSSEWYDGSRLILKGALPNPEGTDTGKEWIEIKNVEVKPVDLKGWKITVGESSVRSYSLQGLVSGEDRLKIYDSETKFTLPNTASRIQLLAPSGVVVSAIRWSKTTEEQVMRTDLKDIDITGTVTAITGPLTFELGLEGEARAILGEDTVSVRFLGLSEEKSDQNTESMEFIGDLIKGQRVELEFDTDMWDGEGNLLAYIIVGSRIMQQDMIISRFWSADAGQEHKRRKEFEDLEKSLKPIADDKESKGALIYEQKSTNTHSGSVLTLSEVYPSPYPASGMVGKEEWEGQEWLELKNPNQYLVDLTDWHLLIDGKKKGLPPGLRVLSGSTVIVGIKLKNAGATLELRNPADVIVSAVTYPELKHGLSYSRDPEGNFCITAKATPGMVNQCQVPIAKAKVRARKTVAKTAVSSRVKAYAAQYSAQMDDEEETVSPVVILRGESESFGMEAMVFAFLSGLAGSSLLLFGSWKIRLVLRSRASNALTT